MALVNKDELISANSSIDFIDNVISTNENLCNQIKSFCDNSKSKLVGGGYDAVRSKMAVYIDALSKETQIYKNLKSNFTAANNTMANYMEEYSSLDDQYIDITRQTLEAAKATLEYLKSQIGIVEGIEALIASCEAEIQRLTRLLEKLEGLAPQDASCYGMISGVEGDVANYQNAVDAIDVTTFNF